jgi:cyclophilin family peptidyl-prolyl cis-trans isomerase
MPGRRLFAAALVCACPALCQTGAKPPTAVIDTTAGRLRCTLLTRERPLTTAAFIALAEGSKPWTAPDGSVVTGKPFYDGTRISPTTAGIGGGTRATAAEKPAGPAFPAETTPAILFDRPGLLATTTRKDEAGPSRFLITDHANREADGRAVVFGECDAASVQLVANLRRALQRTDNHPPVPVAINHIAIVPAGQPMPPPAPPVPAEAILPAQGATTLALQAGPEPSGPTAVLETSLGPIACRLFTKESPIATSTFLGLVDGSKDWTDPTTHTVQHHHRFYDGMPIDRVLPDYYIQFGDITGDISGKTDIGFRFRNENTPGLTFDRPGRLAFGNGGPDTNNSELFFALNPMHALDGGYPIIGQCDEASLKVFEAIENAPRDVSNHPLQPVIIRRITIRQ